MSYVPEPYTHSINKIKVKLDLSNYVTKSDFKNGTSVDTSKFAKEADLASLTTIVDKLDIDKLGKVPDGLNSLKSRADKLDVDKFVPVSADLKKLRDVVKNEVVKKDVYDKLLKKLNAIQTTDTNNLI